jgi:hypothetical protein
MPEKQLKNLDVIDIRFCNLMDMDADDILALCTRALSLGATRLIVDISGNRLTPEAIPVLADICLLDGVEYLFVPEVGQFGAKDELAKLSTSVLEKLIFIRHLHVKGSGWHTVVESTAHQLTVEMAHTSFYDSYPAFQSFRA